MSCDAVRAAWIAGEPLDPHAGHLAACRACHTLVHASPPGVPPPPRLRPDPARFRARLRNERIVRLGVGGVALAAAAFLWLRPGVEEAPRPVPVAVQPTPEVDTGDVLAHPERLAALDLGADLADEPVDVDPLADFDDPTDLFTLALLGNGAL